MLLHSSSTATSEILTSTDGAPDNDEVAALLPSIDRRSATNAMHYIGLGRRTPSARDGTSALKYVGLGKRPSAIKYIGLGKRTPDRSAVHYIGLGKRPAEQSALRYVGLGKRKSALSYIGLGKKSTAMQAQRRRHDDSGDASDVKRRVSKRGRRRVQLRRRWSSSAVDPALLVMGIGRK